MQLQEVSTGCESYLLHIPVLRFHTSLPYRIPDSTGGQTVQIVSAVAPASACDHVPKQLYFLVRALSYTVEQTLRGWFEKFHDHCGGSLSGYVDCWKKNWNEADQCVGRCTEVDERMSCRSFASLRGVSVWVAHISFTAGSVVGHD